MEIKNGQIKVNSEIIFSGGDPELSVAFTDVIKKYRQDSPSSVRINIQKIDTDRKRLINNCCFPDIKDMEPDEDDESLDS